MTTPLLQDTFVKISPQERADFFLKLKDKANLDYVGIYLKSGDTYVYFGTANEFTDRGDIIAYNGPFSDIVVTDFAETDFSNAVDLYYRTPPDPDRGLVKNEFTPVPPYEPVLNTNYRDIFIYTSIRRVDGIDFYFKEGDNFKQVNLVDIDHTTLYFSKKDGGHKPKSVANFYYKYTPPPPIVESINGGKSRRRIRKRRQKTKRRSSRRNNKRP